MLENDQENSTADTPMTAIESRSRLSNIQSSLLKSPPAAALLRECRTLVSQYDTQAIVILLATFIIFSLSQHSLYIVVDKFVKTWVDGLAFIS